MNMFEKQIEKLHALKPVLNAVGNEQLWGLARFLFDRLRNPDSYVVFIGETSSGKSTIINGLISTHILPVSAVPTTGAITEISFSNDNYIKYEVLYRNGTKIQLEAKKEFDRLALRPSKDISRLRVNIPSLANIPKGVRVFDTPGYNSIVDEHEEILKDFLPNADAVVYTVGYKIGIQHEDFTFLRYLRELIRPDVPILLVINRCPLTVTPENPRIKEIKRYVTDILGESPSVHIVFQTTPKDEFTPALPDADSLLKDIDKTINSYQRTELLQNAFDGYIDELFQKCDKELNMRLATAQMSKDAYDSIIKAQQDAARHLYQAIPDLIEPTFTRLSAKVPSLIDNVSDKVGDLVKTRLEKASKFTKDEEINFINNFYLPNELRKATQTDVQDYIQIELTDLNSKVDDYINKEIIEFNNKVAIEIETAVGKAGEGIIKRYVGNTATNALGRYFVQFGGNGGAGAGVANAASHMLKKAGDLIGKRFSRETHNALKHYLAKFGATSMKAVGASVAVLLELAFDIYDISTWKGKARKEVDKALSKWKEETKTNILSDLKKLENENKSLIEEIANETLHAFDNEQPQDYQKAYNDSIIADNWRKLYYTNYE